MNPRKLIIGVMCGCFLSISVCMAGDAAESTRPILEKLLDAVEEKEYADFVAGGSDDFKAGLSPQTFEGVSEQLRPRMKMGYETSYLGNLQQQGLKVYLWKLSYKDGGDDTLAKLVLENGKVAGFWLQ